MNDPRPGMPSAEFRFTSTDGVRVACARWDARGPVRGMVQIAHGMGEHIGRIERYQSAGVNGISHDFYPGRHEMLNETNRDEVRTRLIGWISSVLEHRKLYTRAS
jgi:alpha-beta hydrolase superfamily lysophospholipase